MTIRDALKELGKRLEDTKGDFFSNTHKIHALNLGQKTLCNLLVPTHLKELEKKVTKSGSSLVTDAHGRTYISYDVLSMNTINNGITNIKGKISGNIINFKIVVSSDILDAEDNDYIGKGDNRNGIALLFRRRIYLFCTGNLSSVTVRFIQDPEIITTLTSLDVELKINPALQLLAIDLAESMLWNRDRKYDRAQNAQTNAMKHIGIINEKDSLGDQQ